MSSISTEKLFANTIASKITALACSTPPEGYQRWSLHILSECIVELEILLLPQFNFL